MSGGVAPDVELLSGWFCPYAQRAWIAMEEKCPGTFTVTNAMEVKPPRSFEKAPLLVEKNPKALVPVLIDRRGGEEEVVVCESLICVEYVDEAFGDGKATLLPGPPSQRAHARMWADKLNNEICTEFYRLLLQQDEEGQKKAAEKILGGLRAFSKECKGPFFYGEEMSLVDIAVAPWVAGIRAAVLKHYRQFEVPRTGEFATYWKWHAAVAKHPSFVATASKDLPAMLEVYLPYAQGTGYT
ncbi:hypothetical protein ACHAXT_003249 [Thalassiosira profunda]